MEEKKFNVKNPGKIKKWYEREDIASAYLKKRFDDPLGRLRHVQQIKAINQEIAQRKPKKVLDLACGPARITADLKGDFEGLAADNSPEMLKIAKKRVSGNKWRFRRLDAFKASSLNQKFNLITSFRFVRHFNDNERNKLYSEIRTLLSDNGVFIFDVVNRKKWNITRNLGKLLGKKDSLPVYDRFYTKKEIENELKRNGLRIVGMRPLMNFFLTEHAISNMLCKINLKAAAFSIIKLIDKIKSNNPYEWVVVCEKT